MKAVVLNDTRRDKGHIGCADVMQTLLARCAAHGITVLGSFQRPDAYDSAGYLQQLALADMLIINGEGTLHHDRPNARHLMRAASLAKEAGKRVVLVNAVWQDNPLCAPGLAAFDARFVRESRSLQAMAQAGFSAQIVPDLSLYGEGAPAPANSNAILFTDSVQEDISDGLAQSAIRHRGHYRPMTAAATRRFHRRHPVQAIRFMLRGAPVRTLRYAHLGGPMVTGRFHALCQAVRLGLPCVSTGSNSHKMEGMLEDIGLADSPFHFAAYPGAARLDEAICALADWPPSYSEAMRDYHRDAQRRIDAMFAEIARP